MELPYKLHLGAGCISRPDFLRNLAHAREQRPHCSPETPRRACGSHSRVLELVTASHWYARTACTRGRESLAAGVDACLARSLVGC